jgi:transcription antitermination factor NusG
MKYLITENQKENVIKKYILSNFDRVDDVWFTTRSVYYGSGPINGKDRGEEIIINVLVNNLDDELTKPNLFELKQSIISKTDKTFNLGYNRYGGGWGFSFSQKIIDKF